MNLSIIRYRKLMNRLIQKVSKTVDALHTLAMSKRDSKPLAYFFIE